MKWNVKALISDYLEPERVVKIKNGCVSEVRFEVIGGFLHVEEFDETAEYHLRYRPKIARISSTTANTTEVQIEDRVAAMIPYYIMGELFKHDEPNMASEMRNEYEQYMLTLKPETEAKQVEVESVAGIW